MSNDTLIGLVIILVCVGVPITLGCIVARRYINPEEGTPARKAAPEVRRRTPVRTRTLQPEADAPDRLTAAIAHLVRTVRGEVPGVPPRANAVQPPRPVVPEVPVHTDRDLPANAQELQALWQIGLHMQRGRSKADAIRAVTGVSKGGNQKYQRWARMVDLAKEQPLYRDYSELSDLLAVAPNGHDDA
jgi:hypothetical protein